MSFGALSCFTVIILWTCRMRSRFDPRGIKKALQERNADAIASAKVFADDIKSGVLDPKSEDFNQGTLKFG